MASAEMKILEAEKLHQPMMAAVNMIPIIPLQSKTAVREVELGYFEQSHTFIGLH